MATPRTPKTLTTPKRQKMTEPERGGIPFALNIRTGNVIGAVLILLAAALGSYASQLTMGPVYGDIPSSLHHSKICAAIFAVVWGGKVIFRRMIPRPLFLLPIVAFHVPFIQRYLFRYSDTWGAVNGPIYTEAMSYYPTLLLAVLATSYLLEMPNIALDLIPAGVSYAIFKGARDYIPGFLAYKIGTSWVYTRCGLANLAAAVYSLFAPGAVLLALPGLIHTGLFNPACSDLAGTKYLNASLAMHNYSVLARHESLTGYMSVMQNNHEKYRVMRCDHSLLGGDWLIPSPGLEPMASGEREPIYPVFVMLEAVRLVRPAPAARKPKALMIGLGIGTSHNGMMRHGVETHLVELDPVVYQYAKEYFGLRPDHTAHIMDAVEFVKDAAAEKNPVQYDFIIHDVFTGGAVPSVLFTMDFMKGMHKLLAEDGVIAINFAGDLKQKPAKMVIETIRTVFGNCKVFREDNPKEENKEVDFTNMVIFCTKSPTPFRFRAPLEKDYLGTLSRRQFLWPTFEVNLDKLFRYKYDASSSIKDGESKEGKKVAVLDDKTLKEFNEMQRRGAVHHWAIMRLVIPAAGWENY